LKVLATRRYPGPAFEELEDIEVGALTPRPDVEALIVANEPVQPDSFPSLRRVVEGDRRVRAGEWTGSWADGFLAEELTGSTLGIVGLGRIGQAVARRAAAFELRVVSTRSRSTDEELDQLLAQADIVTIHAPLTEQTRGLIDARRLRLMQDGATLVNTARGEIVDEAALVAELLSGRIRAGLDVFAHEPTVPKELLGLSNVVLTPHLGSATVQTREAMTRLVVDNILAFERSEPLLAPVPD
jgi:glyoxylate reductase